MSSLTENLQTIYGIKQEIKEAIGTSSDIFSDYPAYISAMAGGITPTGYAYVTSNGDYDVSTYAMVNVEVSGGEIPPGYTYVSGTYMLDLDPSAGETPWNYDVTSYAEVSIDFGTQNNINIANNGSYTVSSFGYQFVNGYINVNVPSSGITPSGTITIDDNYNYTTVDVTSYAYADVQISSGGTFDYDSFYSQANIFNEISYGMFDLYNYTSNNPYDNSWMPKYIDPIIEGSSYIWQSVNFITLGDIDLTTQFSGMNPDTTGYSEGSYWKIYDDSNYEQYPSVTSLFDFSTGEQWAHILYQNNSSSDQFIKFARVPMTWDSMGSQWYPDTSNETEINSMPVVTYDEYNGASATRNGTYMFLEDGASIDLYLRFYHGDMGDPDSCEVYSGIEDQNSGQSKWFNIENTNLGKVNFIEYDEQNWPPQA